MDTLTPENSIPEKYFLQSIRLGFRLWSEDDMAIATSLWCDDEVTKFIGGPFTHLQAQQRLFKEIALQEQFGMQYWPFFLLGTGEHIGCCGLRPHKPAEKVYEFGFHIRSRYWGNGYATEAAKTVIEYAFERFTPVALFAGHNPHNAASKHLLEKLHFEYTHDEYYEPTG